MESFKYYISICILLLYGCDTTYNTVTPTFKIESSPNPKSVIYFKGVRSAFPSIIEVDYNPSTIEDTFLVLTSDTLEIKIPKEKDIRNWLDSISNTDARVIALSHEKGTTTKKMNIDWALVHPNNYVFCVSRNRKKIELSFVLQRMHNPEPIEVRKINFR